MPVTKEVKAAKVKRIHTDWLRNATSSIGAATVSELKSYSPNVSNILTSSAGFAKKMVRPTKPKSESQIQSQLKNNKYVKAVDKAFRNALSDLKEGYVFGNESRAMDSSGMDEMFDDVAGSTGVTFGDSEGSTVNNYINAAPPAEIYDRMGEAIVSSAEMNVKMTKAQTDAQIAVEGAFMAQSGQISNQILTHLSGIENNLAALVDYNNQNMNAYIESATAFFEKSGSGETEDAEVERAVDIGDVLRGGKFNMDSYKKLVKKQAKREFSDILFLKDMMNDEMLEQVAVNPLGFAASMGVGYLIPKVVSTTLKGVEETFNAAMPVLLNGLEKFGKEQGGTILGKGIQKLTATLGLHDEGVPVYDVEDIKIDRGATPFDGETKHNITYVIPSLLSESTSYLRNINRYIEEKRFQERMDSATKESKKNKMTVAVDRGTGAIYRWSGEGGEKGLRDDLSDEEKQYWREHQREIDRDPDLLERYYKNRTVRKETLADNLDEISRSRGMWSFDKNRFVSDEENANKAFERIVNAQSESTSNLYKALLKSTQGNEQLHTLAQALINNLATQVGNSDNEQMQNRLMTALQEVSERASVYNEADAETRGKFQIDENDELTQQLIKSVGGLTPDRKTGGIDYKNEDNQAILDNISSLERIMGDIVNNNALALMDARFNPDMVANATTREIENIKNNDTAMALRLQPYLSKKNAAGEEMTVTEVTQEYLQDQYRKSLTKEAGPEVTTEDVVNSLNAGEGIGRNATELLRNIRDRASAGGKDFGKAMLTGDIDGLYTAMGSMFAGVAGAVVDTMDKNFFQPVKKILFGDKDEEGYSRSGILSGAQNMTVDMAREVSHTITGKPYKDSQGVEHPADETAVAQQVKKEFKTVLFGDNERDEEGNRKHIGILGEVTSTIREGLVHWHNTIFGELDKDGNEVNADNVTKLITDNLKENLPNAAVGAAGGAAVGMMTGGMLGSLIGGPIGGAAIGAAAGLLNKNQAFQKWLFGDENKEGGFISKKTQDYVNENKHLFLGAGALGALGGSGLVTKVLGSGAGGFLTNIVGGPVAGALLGIGVSAAVKSNAFQTFLFGDEERGRPGIIKQLNKAIKGTKDDIVNSLPNKRAAGAAVLGIGGGALTASAIGQMGILGSMLTPGGPIVGSLIGLGLAIRSQSTNFQHFLFGNGKDKSDDDYQAGIFGQFKNMLMANVLYPMKFGFQNMVEEFGDALKYDVLDVIEEFTTPVTDFVRKTAGKLGEMGLSIFDRVFGFIGEQAGAPIVEAVRKGVVKPIMGIGSMIARAGTTIVKNAITAPFRIARYVARLVASPIAKVIGGLFKGVKAITNKLFHNILTKAIGNALTGVIGIAFGGVKGLAHVVRRTFNTAGKAVNGIRDWRARRAQEKYDAKWGGGAEGRKNRALEAYNKLANRGELETDERGNVKQSFEEWYKQRAVPDYNNEKEQGTLRRDDNGNFISLDEYVNSDWGGDAATTKDLIRESVAARKAAKGQRGLNRRERKQKSKNMQLIARETGNSKYEDTEANRALVERKLGKKVDWGKVAADAEKAELLNDASKLTDNALLKADPRSLTPEARQSQLLLQILQELVDINGAPTEIEDMGKASAAEKEIEEHRKAKFEEQTKAAYQQEIKEGKITKDEKGNFSKTYDQYKRELAEFDYNKAKDAGTLRKDRKGRKGKDISLDEYMEKDWTPWKEEFESNKGPEITKAQQKLLKFKGNIPDGRNTEKGDLQFVLDWMNENGLITSQENPDKWTRSRLVEEASRRGGDAFTEFIDNNLQTNRKGDAYIGATRVNAQKYGGRLNQQANKVAGKIDAYVDKKVNAGKDKAAYNPGIIGRSVNKIARHMQYDENHNLIQTPIMKNKAEFQKAFDDYLNYQNKRNLNRLNNVAGIDLSENNYLEKLARWLEDDKAQLITNVNIKEVLDGYAKDDEPVVGTYSPERRDQIKESLQRLVDNGDTNPKVMKNIMRAAGITADYDDETLMKKFEEFVTNANSLELNRLASKIPGFAEGTGKEGITEPGLATVGEDNRPELIETHVGDRITPLQPLVDSMDRLTATIEKAYNIQSENTEVVSELVQEAKKPEEDVKVEIEAPKDTNATEEVETPEETTAEKVEELVEEQKEANKSAEEAREKQEMSIDQIVDSLKNLDDIKTGKVGLDVDGNGSADISFAKVNKSGEAAEDERTLRDRIQKSRAGRYIAGFGNTITKGITGVKNAAQDGVTGVVSYVGNTSVGKKAKSGLSSLMSLGRTMLFAGLASAFIKSGGLQKVTGLLTNAIQFIGNKLPDIIETVSEGASVVFNWVAENGSAMLDNIGSAITTAGSWLAENGESILSGIGTMVDTLGTIATTAGSILARVGGGAIDAIETQTYAAEHDTTTDVEDKNESDVTQYGDVAADAFGLAADVAASTAGYAANAGESIFTVSKGTGIAGRIKALFANNTKAAVAGTGTSISKGEGDWQIRIAQMLKDGFVTLCNKVGIPDTKLTTFASEFYDDILGLFKNAEKALYDALYEGIIKILGGESTKAAMMIATAGTYMVIHVSIAEILNSDGGAAQLFYVNKDDVDSTMKNIAAAFVAIEEIPYVGSILELADSLYVAFNNKPGPLTWAAELLYSALADENAQTLEDAQDKFRSEYEDYTREKAYAYYDQLSAAGQTPTDDEGNEISREEYWEGVQDGTYEGPTTSYVDYNSNENKNLGQQIGSAAWHALPTAGKAISQVANGVKNLFVKTYRYYGSEDTKTGNVYIKHGKKWDVYDTEGNELTETPIESSIMEADLNEDAELKTVHDLEDIFGENASNVELTQDDSLADTAAKAWDDAFNSSAHLADGTIAYYSDTESGNVYVQNGDTYDQYDSAGNLLNTGLVESEFRSDLTGGVRGLYVGDGGYTDLEAKRLMFADYDEEATGSSLLDNMIGDKTVEDITAEVAGLEEGYCWYDTSDGCFYTMEDDGTYTYRSNTGGALIKNISQDDMTSLVIRDGLVCIKQEDATSALATASESWRQSIADLEANTQYTYFKNEDNDGYTKVDNSGRIVDENVSEEDVNEDLNSGSGSTVSDESLSDQKYVIVANDALDSTWFVPVTASDGTTKYLLTTPFSDSGVEDMDTAMTYDQAIAWMEKNYGAGNYEKVITNAEEGWYNDPEGTHASYVLDADGKGYTVHKYGIYGEGGETDDAKDSEAAVLEAIENAKTTSAETTDTDTDVDEPATVDTSTTTNSSGYGTLADKGTITGTGDEWEGATYEYDSTAGETGENAVFTITDSSGKVTKVTASQLQDLLDSTAASMENSGTTEVDLTLPEELAANLPIQTTDAGATTDSDSAIPSIVIPDSMLPEDLTSGSNTSSNTVDWSLPLTLPITDEGGSGKGTSKVRKMPNRGTASIKMGGGFGESKSTSLSTNNGFTYASQEDARWANTKYEYEGDGGTMADSGCGPTAMSMVVSDMIGQNVSPTQMAQLAQADGTRDETGTNWNYIADAATSYGLNSMQTINPSTDNILESVSTGNPVVLSGSSTGDETPYTSAGHYIVAVGQDNDGNILVNDPRGTSYSRAYNPEELASYTGSSWEISGGRGERRKVLKNLYSGGRGATTATGDSSTVKYYLDNGYYYKLEKDSSGNTVYQMYTNKGKKVSTNGAVPSGYDITVQSYSQITKMLNSGTLSTTDPTSAQSKSSTATATGYKYTDDNGNYYIKNSNGTYTSYDSSSKMISSNVSAAKVATLVSEGTLSEDNGSSTTATTVDTDMRNNFPFLLQYDSRWGSKSYTSTGDTSQTIASSGCGPTSMAMILRSYGNNVTPEDTANWSVENGYRTANSGTAWGFFSAIGDKYGLTTNEYSTSSNDAYNALGNNIPLVASMGAGDFTKNGHFITVVGKNSDGSVIVNDPNSETRSDKSWSMQTIKNQANKFWGISKNGKGSINNLTAVDAIGGESTTTASDETTAQTTQNEGSVSVTDRYGNYLSGVADLLTKGLMSGDLSSLTAADFEALLNNSTTTTTTTSSGSTSVSNIALTGSDNAEKIWNYLTQLGYSKAGTAGIMGNLYAESGLQPNNLQNTYESSLGMSDDQYTSAVDNGSYTNFVNDSAGYGLAQWTYSSRKQGLKSLADSNNTSIADIGTQLQYLNNELSSSSYNGLASQLKSANDVTSASTAFLLQFERPADQGSSMQAKRASYGQSYYNTYAGAGAGIGIRSLLGGRGRSLVKRGSDDTKYMIMLPGGKGVSSGETVTGSAADAREAIVGWMLCLIGRNSYTQSSDRSRVMEGVDGNGYGDCSSTCCKIYSTALGMSIGSYTGNMYNQGTQILGPNSDTSSYPDETYMLPGDLVFYYSGSPNTSNLASSIGHVEMYIGGGCLAGHGSGTGPKVHNIDSYTSGRVSGGYGTWATVVRYINDGTTYTITQPDTSKFKVSNTFTDGNGKSSGNRNTNAGSTATSNITASTEETVNGSTASDSIISTVGSYWSGVADLLTKGAMSGNMDEITSADFEALLSGTTATTTSTTTTSATTTDASASATNAEVSGAAAILNSANAYVDTFNNALNSGEKWIYSNQNKYVKLNGTFEDMVRGADDGSLQRGANETSIANWALRDMGILSGTASVNGGATHKIIGYTGETQTNIDNAFDVFNYENEGYPKLQKLYQDSELKAGDIIFGDGDTTVYKGSGAVYNTGHGRSNWSQDNSITSDDSKKAVFKSWLSNIGTDSTVANMKVNHIIRPKSDYTTTKYTASAVDLSASSSTDSTVTKPSQSSGTVTVNGVTMSAAGEGTDAVKDAAKLINREHRHEGDGRPIHGAKGKTSKKTTTSQPKIRKYLTGGRGTSDNYASMISDLTTTSTTANDTNFIRSSAVHKATTLTKDVSDIISDTNKSNSNDNTSQLLSTAISLLQTIAENTGSGVDYLQQATNLISNLNVGKSGGSNTYVTQVSQSSTPTDSLQVSNSSRSSRNFSLAQKIAAGK